MNQPEIPTIEEVAMWLGELQINLKMTQKQLLKLQEESEKLRKQLNED